VLKVRILLMGFGNVGRGFCRLLAEKSDYIERHWRLEPRIVGICTRTRGIAYDPSGIDLDRVLSAKDNIESLGNPGSPRFPTQEDVVAGGDYDVLAECTVTSTDGRGPALEYMKEALSRGKSVITTNKGPIAFFYKNLHELACRHRAGLLFEGTVMAGTPVFSTSVNGLAGSRISRFEGVLNGTCNYMLGLMQSGADYDKALEQAQKQGFAEADPAMDVEGMDTALKAMILSQVLMGTDVPRPEDISIQGISHVDPEVLLDAKDNNEQVRLVARGEKVGEKCRISVKPTPLAADHPLYNLPGAVNGLVLSTDTLGPVCLTGAGAGSKATGFALLHDLLSLYDSRERCRKGM